MSSSETYSDEKEIVHRAINKLEPKYRAVIVLRLIEGFSTAETAEILDLPLGTVLSRPTPMDRKSVPKALDRFCRTIIDKNIQLFDLNVENVLIQIDSNGTYHPVSVDLKGRFNNYEFIPVSTYIPYFSRKKLQRRCGRLLEQVTDILIQST